MCILISVKETCDMKNRRVQTSISRRLLVGVLKVLI